MSVEKPVVVTAEHEIESIERNGFGDIVGERREVPGLYPHTYYVADRDSLNEWRERQKAAE